MAKKRKNFFDDADMMERMFMMRSVMNLGVSPEEYEMFYKNQESIEKVLDQFMSGGGEDSEMYPPFSGKSIFQGKEPRKDAEDKSLILKIQMREVTKPPMWRQIVVPADFNFTQLHFAIQAAVGLMNCHLWQFQRQAYNPDLMIGVPQDKYSEYGLDEWTHDSDETPLTSFLAEKGDRLVYVYDFGDDWTFDIKVEDVIERQGEIAELGKYKSDLQAIENIGGVWAYTQMRDLIECKDTLTKRQQKDTAHRLGFDNFNLLLEIVDENMIDTVLIAERMAEIPEHWPDEEYEDLD